MSDKPAGLALLRQPFPAHQISYLPKSGVKLAYVGHAALTDRLLDADPMWTWEPLSMGESGLPVMDEMGGMWIKLTVCGVTRLGYGHAGTKTGGDAIKEVIGDALRNAAMRFGAALELWHKGELHQPEPEPQMSERQSELNELSLYLIDCHQNGKDMDAIRVWYEASTWSADNPTESEERKYVWGQLREFSKLRSAIKSNAPQREAA